MQLRGTAEPKRLNHSSPLADLTTTWCPIQWLFYLHLIRHSGPGFSSINSNHLREHFMVHQPRTKLVMRHFGHANATVGTPTSPNTNTLNVGTPRTCSDRNPFRGRYQMIRFSSCCRSPLAFRFFFPSPPISITVSFSRPSHSTLASRANSSSSPGSAPRVCVILMRYSDTCPDAQMLPNAIHCSNLRFLYDTRKLQHLLPTSSVGPSWSMFGHSMFKFYFC